MGTTYLILHGLGGSGPAHWQTWLYQELVSSGKNVIYPSFPKPDGPDLAEWLHDLNRIMADIPSGDDVTVVAHSLACILWFHHAASQPERKVRKAILVCPPSVHTRLEAVVGFFLPPPDWAQISNGAERTLIVQSTDDPYCSFENTLHYQTLGVPSLMLPGMGHINVDSGHGPWPFILDLLQIPNNLKN